MRDDDVSVNDDPGFSVVIPVSPRDLEKIEKDLPSWLELGSDDVVMVLDAPEDPRLVSKLKGYRVRIVPADTSDYRFKSAVARRVGFRAATHDLILTGDVDLKVNSNCLLALERVRSGYGLASLSKNSGRLTPVEVWRNLIVAFSRRRGRVASFTGLYAFRRSIWLENDDTDYVKKLRHPYTYSDEKGVGDDGSLRDSIRRRRACIYLPEVGGIDYGISTENLVSEQNREGYLMSARGEGLARVMAVAMIRLKPFVLFAYLRAGRARKM